MGHGEFWRSRYWEVGSLRWHRPQETRQRSCQSRQLSKSPLKIQ
ncbi:hypothetical protein [Nostoc sp.]